MYTHEVVRTHLDRREEVSHLMNTFNKDLVESKQTLERYSSPLRQISPYRQSAAFAQTQQTYHSNQNYMIRENEGASQQTSLRKHSAGGTRRGYTSNNHQ